MKGFASELAAAGKKIDDHEMKGYIFNGLDDDYNILVASTNVLPSITLTNMCAYLIAFDYRQQMLIDNHLSLLRPMLQPAVWYPLCFSGRPSQT
jgi:hypothetical protein